MNRSFLAGAKCVLCGSLLCGVLTALGGCGAQPTTEAAVETVQTSATVEGIASPNARPSRPVQAADVVAAMKPQPSTAGQTPTKTATAKSAEAPKSDSANSDESHRKRILGTWLQNNNEKRTITVKEDGTASIVAELNDYRQYVVGKTLNFDVEWTLNDGKLTFVTTGGRPPESIKYITTIYGKSRVYRIIEFVEDRLLLKKDETGEDEPEWTRIAE